MKAKAKGKPGADPKPGRPRTGEAIREVILKVARETGCDTPASSGELKKLGVRSVSRLHGGQHPARERHRPWAQPREGTWTSSSSNTPRRCGPATFFTKNVWTLKGLVEYYLFFRDPRRLASRPRVRNYAPPGPRIGWLSKRGICRSTLLNSRADLRDAASRP